MLVDAKFLDADPGKAEGKWIVSLHVDMALVTIEFKVSETDISSQSADHICLFKMK